MTAFKRELSVEAIKQLRKQGIKTPTSQTLNRHPNVRQKQRTGERSHTEKTFEWESRVDFLVQTPVFWCDFGHPPLVSVLLLKHVAPTSQSICKDEISQPGWSGSMSWSREILQQDWKWLSEGFLMAFPHVKESLYESTVVWTAVFPNCHVYKLSLWTKWVKKRQSFPTPSVQALPPAAPSHTFPLQQGCYFPAKLLAQMHKQQLSTSTGKAGAS